MAFNIATAQPVGTTPTAAQPGGFDLSTAQPATAAPSPEPQAPQAPSRAEQLRMQQTLVTPGEESTLGAMGAGFRRGMESVGEGVTQRALDVYEFFGGEAGDFREELDISRKIQEQKFKPTKEERPIAAMTGEIAGSIAALPIPAATIPKAMAAGAGFGASKYLEEGEGLGTFAKNVAVDATIGGLAQAAMPYLQKGFNKSQAMFSGIIKRATGTDPRPGMFTPEGNLSDEGINALEELGMTEQEFSRIYQGLDESLNPVQAARQARAEEAGIDLTTGQVTRTFGTQEAEETLKAGLGTEATAARQFAEGQQEQMRAATERFTRGMGDVTAGRSEAGRAVQEGLKDIQQEGRQKVSQMYAEAAAVPGDLTPINTEELLDVIDENVIGRPVDANVVNSIESLMAKYGLIEGTVEQAGRFRQVVQADGSKVKFKGEQETLGLDNAEKFRQGLNQILPADQSGTVSQIIRKLDDTVGAAVDELPTGSARTEAFQAARGAAREQKKIFAQKDMVQNLVDYKKGTTTLATSPDAVMSNVYKGVKGLDNLQKVKSALMSKPTNKSVGAWKSIQAQGAADIFADAINPATGDISGARLNSAIKKLGSGSIDQGERKLKVLLGDKYKEFKNLQAAIGDATIPVKGVTNPSGTAYKLINFMVRVGSVGQFGMDALATVAGKVKGAAKSRRTLRNIKTASPDKVKQAVKDNNDIVDAFMALGASRAAQTGREEL